MHSLINVIVLGLLLAALSLIVRAESHAEELTIMTWDEIDESLQEHPPGFTDIDAREKLLRAVDERVLLEFGDRTVNEALSGEHAELSAFYRRQVDRGLDALETTEITNGVGVWKFYSSSVVLKSANGILAIDFCQGPIPYELTEAEHIPHGIHWTAQQRRRLAMVVNVLLVTHWHTDHNDGATMKLLANRGKPIMVAADMKAMADRINPAAGMTVADFSKPMKVGPCEIRVLKSYQFMGLGSTIPDPLPEPGPGDPENNVYLIRMGGLTFLVAGEGYDTLEDWLRAAKEEGWDLNVVFSTGFKPSADSIFRVYPDVLHIPVHDHEFTHPDGGNPFRWHYEDRERIRRRRKLILVWGEHFLLTEDLFR